MAKPTSEPMGRVLVVDTDYDTLSALARVLRTRGHQVVLATDGRTGLARAVEIAADVVLLDKDIPVLDARTFLDVMRDNPRTGTTHAFVMGRGDTARLGTLDPRAEPIVKPFNPDEVAARVEDVIRSRRAPEPQSDLKGDLAQVALFDLLQVFSVNRRTGKLHVETPRGAGEVWVRDGQIVDAAHGATTGEKALYRILAFTEGRFVFVPDAAPARVRLSSPTDHLLMEAVRQADEMGRLRDELPSPTARVRLEGQPDETTQASRQVMEHLDVDRTLEELLDRIEVPDLTVLEGVRQLLTAGVLRVVDTESPTPRLGSDEDLPALRAASLRLRRPGVEGPPRLAVLVGTMDEVERFGSALAPLRGFIPAGEPPVDAGGGPVGPIGLLRFDGAELEVLVIPAEPTLRPLWGPLLATVTAALVLGEPSDVESLATALDIRLVPSPPDWDTTRGAIEAIRATLGAVAPSSSVGPSPEPR
ncbi:MAG: DUF4388 domain-containing protein [Myxococcota bacterium]